MKKIIFIILFILGCGVVQSQTKYYWITDPNIVGKLTFANGWTLYDTTGGLKIPSSLWVGGSELYLGNGPTILKDSSGFLILNNPIIIRALGSGSIPPWIKTAWLEDTSITKGKLKPGSITSYELSSGVKDSIFSATNLGTLDKRVKELKERADILFSVYGNFKSSVFNGSLHYDSTNKLVWFDSSKYWTKSALDTNTYISVHDMDTTKIIEINNIDSNIFIYNANKLQIKNYSIPLIKIDSSKFGTGIKYNPGSGKIEVKTANDTLYLTKNIDNQLINRPHIFLTWTDRLSSTGSNQFVKRFPGDSQVDTVGYGMSKSGYIVYYSVDNQLSRTVDGGDVRDTLNRYIRFVSQDFINIQYLTAGGIRLKINGITTGLDLTAYVEPNYLTTFMLECVLDN